MRHLFHPYHDYSKGEIKVKDYLGYKDKVCVVTGAASGMGRAAAEMLVDLGAKVYALDWVEAKVEGLAKYIHTDLSKKESINQAFAQIPAHIDSFFGIAGVSGSKTDFVTTAKIDLIANMHICEEILPSRMSEGGSIGFITSTGGNGWEKEGNKKVYLPIVQAGSWDKAVEALGRTMLPHLPGTLAYPFSKLAMNYYTIQLQATYAPKGIRVNAVLPGSTDTGMKDEFTAMAGGEEALLSHTGYAKRLALSEEMAGPIVFLNSPMASYISGELLRVDYACTAEQVAGLAEDGMRIDMTAVLEHIKNASRQ